MLVEDGAVSLASDTHTLWSNCGLVTLMKFRVLRIVVPCGPWGKVDRWEGGANRGRLANQEELPPLKLLFVHDTLRGLN